MKEHSLFLMAGFPAVETNYIDEANWYRDILSLWADHVLREANHYLRLLEEE